VALEQASAAAAALAGAETAERGLTEQLAEANAVVADFADESALKQALADIDAAEKALTEARAVERRRRTEERTAAAHLERLRADEQTARTDFEAVRDMLAALGPPGPPTAKRLDLGADWGELVAWAEARSLEAGKDEGRARQQASDATAGADELIAKVRGWCEELGVIVGTSPGEAAAAALADAEVRADHIRQAIDERRRVEEEAAGLRSREQVAKLLALHLRADHFEKWLLEEALTDLTAGATGLLHELSGGAYSLTLDDKTRDFAVVDHRNADERRAVRTLSGGETFLASLALALALAERVSDMAASGAARLEALFLDEGFGTLDADTLDTVAAAIENLGATGRMVGLVTHVRELAERVPVRFEVTKGPASAVVERVVS
jgi:exonuclease SbcC